MNRVHLFAVVAALGFTFFAGCESTNTAQRGPTGSQEAKHIAAVQKEDQENASVDESERNLWNSQRDVLVRDGNPTTRYY